jgi:hypothetical protein
VRIPNLQVTPNQRFETGCIATLTDGTTQHFTGAGKAATRAVAAYCDEHGCKVVCLSTPSTIYRDLQGTRMMTHDRNSDSLFYAPPPDDNLGLPEPFMLALIGRGDLVA